MKKALVFSLMALFAFGITSFATISGSWDTSMTLSDGVDDALTIGGFTTTLGIDYTVGDWNFGSFAYFTLDAFELFKLDAVGTLGAFSGYAMVVFEPYEVEFNRMFGAASVSIAGVSFYAYGQLQDLAAVGATPIIGSGWVFGGSGAAGDVSISAQVQFNMNDLSGGMHDYGFDFYVPGYVFYYDCGYSTAFAVQTGGCTPAWSGLDVYVDFPFACVDVLTSAHFSCAGFDSFEIDLNDIDLGISWLLLDDLDLTFTTDSKTIDIDLNLVLSDTACITPYVSLIPGTAGNVIEGFEINALTMEYTWNGVTFLAGEIFSNDFTWYRWIGTSESTWGFTYDGALSRYGVCAADLFNDVYNATYDEYFGLLIDGDSCCGGAFAVAIMNWFDADAVSDDSLFDWQETLASISVGIGTNTTVYGRLSMKTDGLNYLSAGFEFTW